MGEEKRVGAGNRVGEERKEWVQVTGLREEKTVGIGNRRGRREKSGYK